MKQQYESSCVDCNSPLKSCGRNQKSDSEHQPDMCTATIIMFHCVIGLTFQACSNTTRLLRTTRMLLRAKEYHCSKRNQKMFFNLLRMQHFEPAVWEYTRLFSVHIPLQKTWNSTPDKQAHEYDRTRKLNMTSSHPFSKLAKDWSLRNRCVNFFFNFW